LDLPQITLPTPLYNALLCSLIVMASWHFISVADGVRRRLLGKDVKADDNRGR
jgi:hypothetical protein